MLKAAERRGCGHISLIVCRKCGLARESGERNKLRFRRGAHMRAPWRFSGIDRRICRVVDGQSPSKRPYSN
jgi:hypothetical protein